MLHELKRSRLSFYILLISITLFFFSNASNATAAVLKSNPEMPVAPQSSAHQKSDKETTAEGSASTMTAAPSPQEESVIVSAFDDSPATGATPARDSTGQASSSATARTPLTPRQKFEYFLHSSFLSPTPYALSALSGIFSEATDKDHGRHMTAGDFLADSATHAARSMAFRTTANFFEKFAFAAAFHQDPRYFRSDKHGFARVSYAISRVFITQSDNGHNQFNASFFAGGLVTAGISNVWSRRDDRTVSSTMGRFGLHVAYRGLSNVVHELFGRR
jgi:hypothetical protein